MLIITDSATVPSIDVPVYAEVQHRPSAEAGAELQQTLFTTRCAQCHGAPAAAGRIGEDLYAAICAMCHPDEGSLSNRGEPLRTAIAVGDLDRSMPAYAREQGGPLSDDQIDSLVRFIASE